MFYIGPWIKAFSCRHDCFSNGSNFPGQFRSEVKSSHFSIPIELASGLTIVRGKRGGGTNIHTYRRTKTIKITQLSKNRANVVRFFFFQTHLGGLVMWGLFYFFFFYVELSQNERKFYLYFFVLFGQCQPTRTSKFYFLKKRENRLSLVIAFPPFNLNFSFPF